MTAQRQPPKLQLFLVLGLILTVSNGSTTASAKAAGMPPEPVVINVHTGLALSGFDPVAYFTEHKPKLGRPDLELRRNGAVWQFCNEGNRAAFADRPDVYGPQFGGYDPVAIARGLAVAGHPLFWAIRGQRLYLFYSPAARVAFLANPKRIILTAERKWPAVARMIAR